MRTGIPAKNVGIINLGRVMPGNKLKNTQAEDLILRGDLNGKEQVPSNRTVRGQEDGRTQDMFDKRRERKLGRGEGDHEMEGNIKTDGFCQPA